VCARAPSTSVVALRIDDDKRAARGGGFVKPGGKAAAKNLRRTDFCPGARCAFVTTNAQRATYDAPTASGGQARFTESTSIDVFRLNIHDDFAVAAAAERDVIRA